MCFQQRVSDVLVRVCTCMRVHMLASKLVISRGVVISSFLCKDLSVWRVFLSLFFLAGHMQGSQPAWIFLLLLCRWPKSFHLTGFSFSAVTHLWSFPAQAQISLLNRHDQICLCSFCIFMLVSLLRPGPYSSSRTELRWAVLCLFIALPPAEHCGWCSVSSHYSMRLSLFSSRSSLSLILCCMSCCVYENT